MIINDYLRESGMTKYQLAKKCGLPYGTLNDIITGKTDIAKCTGETLHKVANAVGCTVDELLAERFGTCAFDLNRIKKLIAPIAEKYGLRSVYVFGSYARGEASEDSDVDIMIDRKGSSVHGIFGMNALFNELKEVLGKEIDLVTVQSLNQASTLGRNADFAENVIKERVKVYG